MTDLNTVILIGRLVADPEVKALASGINVLNMRLAVTTTKKKDDKYEDKANFFALSYFIKSSGVVKFLSKGVRIGITGHLEQDQWETDDGTKRSSVKVLVEKLQVLDFKKDKLEDTEEKAETPVYEDDVPF